MNEKYPEGRARFLSAVHLFLIRDNKILLLRRYNTGYEDGNYGVVAGHIDGQETATAAVIREAREEAGITLFEPKFVHMMHRRKSDGIEKLDFFFTCDEWGGEVCNTEPHKCDDLSWFPIDRLPKNMIEYVSYALENFFKGVPYSEHGWDR